MSIGQQRIHLAKLIIRLVTNETPSIPPKYLRYYGCVGTTLFMLFSLNITLIIIIPIPITIQILPYFRIYNGNAIIFCSIEMIMPLDTLTLGKNNVSWKKQQPNRRLNLLHSHHHNPLLNRVAILRQNRRRSPPNHPHNHQGVQV